MTKGELLNKTLSALFLPLILLLLFTLNWQYPKGNPTPILGKTKLVADSILYNPSIFNFKHPYLEEALQQEDKDQYDSAIIHYQEAANRFEKDNNWLAYIWTNNQIANLYLNVSGNDFTKSKPYLDQSRNASKYRLKENHPFLSSTKYYYGLYYYKSNEADSALYYLNGALKDRIKFFGENTTYVANVYNDLGNVYMIILYNATEAEKAFQKSLKILERILPPDDPEFVYSFFNLTTISQYKRDFEKASTYSFKTLEKIKQLRVNKADWEELMQGMSGDIFKESGKIREAREMYLKAINLSESNNGNLYNRGYYYWRLGELLVELDSIDSGLLVLKKSLQIAESLKQLDYGLAASVYLSLGTVAKRTDDGALHYLRKALEESIRFFGKEQTQTASVYMNLGKFWLEREKIDSALKYCQQAIHVVSDGFDTSSIYALPNIRPSIRDFEVLEILGSKADLLKELYKRDSSKIYALESALKHYHLIDSLILRFDLALAREKSKMILSDFLYHFYEEALDACFQLNEATPDNTYTESGLYFIDKRKAYVLYQNIKEDAATAEGNRRSGSLNSDKQLKDDYFFIQSKIEEEANSGNPDQEVLSSLHSKLLDIEKILYSGKQNHKNADIISFYSPSELMTRAKDYSQKNNTALLNYFWGDKAIYISAICQKENALIKVPLTEELKKHIATYRRTLNNGFRWNQRKEDFKSFCQSSFFTYNHLFKPLSAYLKKIKMNSDFTIVPDGPLSYVPFESLISELPSGEELNYKELKYLVKSSLFTYSYSSKLLFQRNETKKNLNDQILALGYSKLNQNERDKERKSFIELPGTTAEIKSIEKHIDGKFVSGPNATESVFKRSAEKYELLHLAIHGQSDDLNTYHSRLVFNKEIASIEDGYLYPYELYNLKLNNVKLAFLSACESGDGKAYRGEGIYSLARGFIHSGCASVIMSLWRVNDQSSKILVDRFYEELRKGSPIDKSLRLSKLNYLSQSNSKTSHPSNWSSFVSIGNTKAGLNFSANNILSFIIFLLVLAIAIALVARRRRKKAL